MLHTVMSVTKHSLFEEFKRLVGVLLLGCCLWVNKKEAERKGRRRTNLRRKVKDENVTADTNS